MSETRRLELYRASVNQTISDYERLIGQHLASLTSRVNECDSNAARYIVDAKMNIELLKVAADEALQLDHEDYEPALKRFKDHKAVYFDLNEKLLDLVSKFANECKCTK